MWDLICTVLENHQNKQELKLKLADRLIPNEASIPLTKKHLEERNPVQKYLLQYYLEQESNWSLPDQQKENSSK